MKILQLNSVCGYGSTGRIAADLSETLKENGHHCLTAFGRGQAPAGIDTCRIGSSSEVFLHCLKTRTFDKHGLGSRKATEKLLETMEAYKPDLVHLHNIHGYYVNIEILFHYLRELKTPVVWTLHDCWSFTGHCSHFDYIGCERWKTGCYSCPQKHMYPKSKLIDNSKWNYERKKNLFTSVPCMAMVTPSRWLGAMVKNSFLSKYPVKVLNNGIDLNVFQPLAGGGKEKEALKEKYGCGGKYVVLGVASIWTERKGIACLLDLAGKLHGDFKLVIIGITEKQKKGLPQNVVGLTRTSDVQELAKIYSMADVYVNTTLEDSFPTTNLEALACGTPVITFNTGGSPESVDNSCGAVVEKGNVDQLHNAIIRMKTGPVKWQACLAKAQEFDKKEKYKEYIKLYHDMVAENERITPSILGGISHV